jgi:glutamate N-acetyltransferase / amino-acid N-acetyltransferase
MATKTSTFATKFPQIPAIEGVEISTSCSGMRYKKDDIFFAKFSEGTKVAGLLTSSTIQGEPVLWCRKILPHGKARALVVNSGYSNVLCGEVGKHTIKLTVEQAIKMTNCKAEEVYIASTGIIGQPVNNKLLIEALDKKLKPSSWEKAAVAINTTDTFNKGVYFESIIGGVNVKIAGIIKGSGMIAPNMATMLGFLFTDAAISSSVLDKLMKEVVGNTYHSITVDSDTSTSDAVLVFATGKAGNKEITDIHNSEFADFRAKFFQANLELAKLVVKDGEGATKFVTITVAGAVSDNSARTIALSVANSPLVKTAIAGEDPNWGRIAGAIGKSGEPINKDKVNIWLGENQVAESGALSPDYNEKKCKAYMKNKEININIDVGMATAVSTNTSTVYTIDLTHGYIEINADYRS